MVVNAGEINSISKVLKQKTGYSLWGYIWRILMLVLAVLFFIGGSKLLSLSNKISIFKDYKPTSSMTETADGKVVSCERADKNLYNTVIEYKVDGKTYRYTIKEFATSKEDNGQEVQVKYDPSDPTSVGIVIPDEVRVVINLVFIFSILLLLLGGVCSVITLIIIIRVINPKKKNTYNDPQNMMMNQ